MKEKKPETMVSWENRQEAEELLCFLNTLKLEQKKELMAFLQGVRFMKNIVDSGVVAVATPHFYTENSSIEKQ